MRQLALIPMPGKVVPKKPKLRPRLGRRKHLNAKLAYGDKPRALCWAAHYGNLGYATAHNELRLVDRISLATCKWCRRVLTDHAQLQHFYVLATETK